MTTINIRESNKTASEVWGFFDNITDVNNLDPTEEQGKAWECYVDGKLVGMAVGDPIPSYGMFLERVAVDPAYRKMGIATELLETILSEYDTVKCRVHKTNDCSQNLLESVGFSKDGMGRYDELIKYNYSTN